VFLEIIIFIFGLILNIVGFVGCFIPILPGPTLNLLSIFLLQFTQTSPKFSMTQLSLFTFATLVVLIIDNFLPIMTARAYGSSLKGTVGASIGLFVGFFFFPPFGMIVGAFIGAFIGELLSKKKNKEAIKAGLATTLGFVFGAGAKLAVAGVLSFYFVKYANIWSELIK